MSLFGQIKNAIAGKKESQPTAPGFVYYGLPKDLPPLAPDVLKGYDLSYHYDDVTAVPTREFSTGKTGIKKHGIRRGDPLVLRKEIGEYYGSDDKENIAVYWKNIKIGDLHKNRLRGMVHQWSAKNLPIFCAVAEPRDNNEIMIEIGFYGKPGAKP